MPDHPTHHTKGKGPSRQQLAIIAGAGVLLLLLYRYYASQSGASSGASTPATDSAGADYAALAGQQQSDVAGLQAQNQQLLAQERSDVTGLQGLIAGLTGQVSGLADTVSGLGTATTTTDGVSSSNVAAAASGSTQTSRTSITKGISGRARGITAVPRSAAVRKTMAAASKHPQHTRNVAHPNPGHTPKTGQHKTATTGSRAIGILKPALKPKPAAKPKPPPKPPPKPKPKTKVKSSGRRR